MADVEILKANENIKALDSLWWNIQLQSEKWQGFSP